MLRDFTQPNKPQAGCARLAAVRLIATCTDMLSLVSNYPHICLLPDPLQQLLLTLLLLSWSAHTHAVRLKDPLPLHTARVPTIKTLVAGLHLLLYLPAFAGIPPSLRAATPSPSESSDDGGTAALHAAPVGRRLMPTGLSLCLAFDDAGLHLNQLPHREQGPALKSAPMKLLRSLLFASSRVLVSPVQPALLPASPRIDGFHSLDYRSHRVGHKAECPKEQTHQLGGRLSIPHITPIARNDTKLS